MNEYILKVLVGSRAHGLHTDQSDYDYRGVFVQSTEEILALNGEIKTTDWVEGRDVNEAGRKQDDTSWEIGHFLKLAVRCNPTILETFAAPIEESTDEGLTLRDLFPYIWNPRDVRDAFINYSLNQRKKLLEEKDKRPLKYAVTYLRTLLQAERLLIHKVLMMDVTKHEEYQTLLMIKNGMLTPGDIINKCLVWQRKVEAAYTICKHIPDHDKVNNFLLKIRMNHFTYKEEYDA